MISLFNLPSLPYVIFELLRFKKQDIALTGEAYAAPESIEVIVMDVQPTRFSYTFGPKRGLNAGYGDDNYTSVIGGEAPRRIMLQGTFGDRPISRGAITRDGFERLQQFKNMARKSFSVNDESIQNLPDSFQYIYALNYYDFNERYWEAINIDEFTIEKDAQRHSTVPSYVVKATGLGKLVDAVPKDPFLRNMKIAIKIQEEMNKINKDIVEFINSEVDIFGVSISAPEILADIETAQIALAAVTQMTGQYTQVLNGIPGVNAITGGVTNLLSEGLGSALSFANLLD